MTFSPNPFRYTSWFPNRFAVLFSVLLGGLQLVPANEPTAEVAASETKAVADYAWTRDHMHVGVRWQPFSREQNDRNDGARPVISEDSSYVQFWVSWNAAEREQTNTDYENNMSDYLRGIERAVDFCVSKGIKTELVFWHTPAWAALSGRGGHGSPREGEYAAFVTRMATHFKGRVDAYQLAHEANLRGFYHDRDIDFLIKEIFIKGARAIRAVYDAEPAQAVMISTSGCSPCDSCEVLEGLPGIGGEAVNGYYSKLVGSVELMREVDALNLNVSDHFDGYGMMDGSYVTSAWGNYELARGKLDAAGYRHKTMLSAESWIVWDDAGNATDVNGDGFKDERDAYAKTVTIMGQCLQRGLNTMNLPWSDNSSSWAMGLTKRVDYNGRIKELKPTFVVSATGAHTGSPDIVTRKVALHGKDDTFKIKPVERSFTEANYINPGDPNHLHYYIWRWYAQIAGGSDEVIRHARGGEIGNDITTLGPGYTGAERYRISSYNRSQKKFTVLLYAGGAGGKSYAKLSIPSTVQTGYYYNNDTSKIDFRGEGFAEGERYVARVTTKTISLDDGSDVDVLVSETLGTVVEGKLQVRIGRVHPFTKVEFFAAPADTPPAPEKPAVAQNELAKLSPNIIEQMDVNKNKELTESEYVGFWAGQFAGADKDRDGLLDAKEFPYPASLKPADSDQDGKLSIDEHRSVYRSQFRGLDTNKDGRLN